MPISIGSKRWGLCRPSRSTLTPKRKRSDSNPEVHHNEIAHRALLIYQIGIISKDEYQIILEADLKCRNPCDLPEKISIEKKESYEKDPITLEELGDLKHTFVTTTGICIHYNLESIVRYVSSTGDFSDPVSRLPLTLEDLEQIDVKVSASGLSLPSLVEVYQNKESFTLKKIHHQEIQSLEACLGELVMDMLRVIEQSLNREDAQYRMSVICSEFDAPFQMYKLQSLEMAYQSLFSWIAFIRGPQKRPTKDCSRTLRQAISFLQGEWTSSDANKLKALRSGSRGESE